MSWVVVGAVLYGLIVVASVIPFARIFARDEHPDDPNPDGMDALCGLVSAVIWPLFVAAYFVWLLTKLVVRIARQEAGKEVEK